MNMRARAPCQSLGALKIYVLGVTRAETATRSEKSGMNDPPPRPQYPSLLLKLLFTSQPLSIQVHPNDAFAHSMGLPNGKTEAGTF